MSAPVPAVAPQPAPADSAARPADWTENVSLIQPRQAAFWLFSLLLLVSSIGFLENQLAYVDMSTTAWLVALVLLGLYAVPVFVLVNMLDLFEREPRSLLFGALLWGGVVAFFLAGQINDQLLEIVKKLFGADFALSWGAAFVGPGVEELLKFLGVVVIYLIARSEFDDVLDGFVYGALVGLGFTLVEDMQYFFHYFVGQPGVSDVDGLLQGYFLRVIVGGPYSHVLLTGLTGMGLAYYVTRPDVARQRRRLVAIGLYAAGVAAHFVWNSPLLQGFLGAKPDEVTWIIYGAIKGLPFLILLAILVRVAMRREQRWVRETLADDVDAGLVTAAELDILTSLRQRRAARKAAGVRKGPAGERLLARLQHAQIALALTETGSAPNREAKLAADRDLIRSLRSQADALPDVAAAHAPVVTAGAVGGAASPAPAPAAGPFTPTHQVPVEGLPAWPIPDGRGSATALAGGLELEIVQRAADWAHVRASNGWTGWVDGRRLLPKAPPTA